MPSRGHNNSNKNDNNRNGWSHPAPVWGRSAAAVVAISSSPSNSSFGSSSSSNGSARSLSRSSANTSPGWGPSLQASTAASRSPSQTRNTSLATKTPYYDQQRGFLPTRSRSPSPQQLSTVLVDDYRDEVTTSTPLLQPQRHRQEQTLLISQKISSSPRLSHDLCTIAEDRKISSNTLSQMAVTSTAEEIAKSPVLAKRRPQQKRKQQDQSERNQQIVSPKIFDPYKDDAFDDSRDQDCTDCWAYQKSRFNNWWPFGNHPKAICNSDHGLIGNQERQISQWPIPGRTAGFPAVHRRVHVRRISF